MRNLLDEVFTLLWAAPEVKTHPCSLHLHEAGQADHHGHHQRGDDVDKGPEYSTVCGYVLVYYYNYIYMGLIWHGMNYEYSFIFLNTEV